MHCQVRNIWLLFIVPCRNFSERVRRVNAQGLTDYVIALSSHQSPKKFQVGTFNDCTARFPRAAFIWGCFRCQASCLRLRPFQHCISVKLVAKKRVQQRATMPNKHQHICKETHSPPPPSISVTASTRPISRGNCPPCISHHPSACSCGNLTQPYPK